MVNDGRMQSFPAMSIAELRPGELIRRTDMVCRHAFDRLVRERHLVPLTESTARRAAVASTPRLRALALADDCPQQAVIGGTSAAWIFQPRLGAHLAGLVPPGTTVRYRQELHRGPVTCYYSARDPRPHQGDLAKHRLRQTRFSPGDVLRVHVSAQRSVLVTSAERTVLDLVCQVEGTSVLRALETFHSAGVDLQQVVDRLRSLHRWTGRARGVETIETYLRWNRG